MLTKKEKSIYAIGLFGQNMIYNFMALFITIFFTDVLKLDLRTVGIITVVASLWDALNDPLMGMIADKTRTKLGKFRPYLLVGPFILIITTTLCYYSFGGDPTSVAIFAAVAYILWGMSYTVSDIPIWSLASVSSPIPKERDSMVTLGKIGGTVGAAVITVVGIKIINLFGGEALDSSYFKAALLVSVIGGLLMLLVGLFCKERVEPPKKIQTFKENFKTLSSNNSMKALFLSLFLINIVNNIRQISQAYFAKYVWEDSSLMTLIGVSLILGMVFGMVISSKLMEKRSKKNVMTMACILGSVSCLIPMINYENIVFGLVFLGISFLFTGITTIVSMSMLMDCIDYSETQLGFRGEGFAFSINTFLNKFAKTISSLIVVFSLAAFGYVENMVPTGTIKFGISAIIYIVPAIVFVLAIIPIRKYNLEEK